VTRALKYTGEDGHVTIRVRAENDHEFSIEVEDTGVGIRPDDVDRLFVEFQQLDAGSSKSYQGTGLGLALTRRILEAQGGRVGVRSTHGVGNVFSAIPDERCGCLIRSSRRPTSPPIPRRSTP
jgi:signal transduction histidine kinase